MLSFSGVEHYCDDQIVSVLNSGNETSAAAVGTRSEEIHWGVCFTLILGLCGIIGYCWKFAFSQEKKN